METRSIPTAEDFDIFTAEILTQLPKKETASVIALSGDLGAGKTTFTQALARTLGVTEHVTSPTFMIMRTYGTHHEQFTKLVHIDAYRVEDESEIEVLGITDLFKDPQTLVCIEWAERIPQIVPKDALYLNIDIAEDTTRDITYGYKE